MLDPLGIAFSGFRVKPQAQEEAKDDLVPLAAFLGESAPLLGQKHRAILGARDQTVTGQAAERFSNRRRRHPHSCRDVDGPRFALLMNKLCDQLDIVFGYFAAPRLSNANEGFHPGFGRASFGFLVF